MIIKASKHIRNNYGEVSKLAHTTGEPIYITNNGEGDLVVMSIDAFQRRDEYHALRAKLESVEANRIAGASSFTAEESTKRVEELLNAQ